MYFWCFAYKYCVICYHYISTYILNWPCFRKYGTAAQLSEFWYQYLAQLLISSKFVNWTICWKFCFTCRKGRKIAFLSSFIAYNSLSLYSIIINSISLERRRKHLLFGSTVLKISAIWKNWILKKKSFYGKINKYFRFQLPKLKSTGQIQAILCI